MQIGLADYLAFHHCFAKLGQLFLGLGGLLLGPGVSLHFVIVFAGTQELVTRGQVLVLLCLGSFLGLLLLKLLFLEEDFLQVRCFSVVVEKIHYWGFVLLLLFWLLEERSWLLTLGRGLLAWQGY